MKNVIIKFMQGAALGMGAILPGVSSGALALTMGIYDSIVTALTKLFRAFRQNLLYLLPIGLGAVLGVIGAGNLLARIFLSAPARMTLLFCGFVIGNILWLSLEAKVGNETKHTPKARAWQIWGYVLCALLGLITILLLAHFETHFSANAFLNALTPIKAVVAGAVLALGLMVPGISASLMLVYMGTYYATLRAIGTVELNLILFMAIGFVVMSILLLIGAVRVLRKHHASSYCFIIGFSLGTVALVLPRAIVGMDWLCPFLFILGLSTSILMGYLKAKKLGMTNYPPELLSDILLPSECAKGVGIQNASKEDSIDGSERKGL